MSLMDQMTQESIKQAVAQRLQTKGRLFEIDPLRKPRHFDAKLIQEACDDAGNHAVRSVFSDFHDEMKPIADTVQKSISNHLEKQGYDESFLHFFRNYSLSSEDVLDLLVELVSPDGEIDG